MCFRQVLSAVTRPSEAKFHTYGAWRYAIHAGCMDFRAAAHAACSQDEAEALLAGVYSSILRQFLIAVSELEGGHLCAMCRRARVRARACACAFACVCKDFCAVRSPTLAALLLRTQR